MFAETWRIDAVLTGTSQPLRGAEPSAIAKHRHAGSIRVLRLGIEGDEQADRINHGGVDMAVHHYPRDHYPHWQSLIDNPLLDDAGALGENISTIGLTETEACIGDRYRLGTSVVEVSQGRKPCWKPAHRLGHKTMVADIVATARSGWYYRVIEEGEAGEGDMLTLIERPHPEWTVARVFGILVRGDRDDAALTVLCNLDALSAHWRGKAANRLSA